MQLPSYIISMYTDVSWVYVAFEAFAVVVSLIIVVITYKSKDYIRQYVICMLIPIAINFVIRAIKFILIQGDTCITRDESFEMLGNCFWDFLTVAEYLVHFWSFSTYLLAVCYLQQCSIHAVRQRELKKTSPFYIILVISLLVSILQLLAEGSSVWQFIIRSVFAIASVLDFAIVVFLSIMMISTIRQQKSELKSRHENEPAIYNAKIRAVGILLYILVSEIGVGFVTVLLIIDVISPSKSTQDLINHQMHLWTAFTILPYFLTLPLAILHPTFRSALFPYCKRSRN